jgi:hypothetical protein
MEKEFVPCELSVKLKLLGFDEPCLGFYNHQGQLILMAQENESVIATYKNSDVKIGMQYAAPTFSQALRWFRDEYNIYSIVLPSYADSKVVKDRFFYEVANGKKLKQELEYHVTYEEAELACLIKLIEIIEQTNAEMTEHGVYK